MGLREASGAPFGALSKRAFAAFSLYFSAETFFMIPPPRPLATDECNHYARVRAGNLVNKDLPFNFEQRPVSLP
jgi:hypothetical protein